MTEPTDREALRAMARKHLSPLSDYAEQLRLEGAINALVLYNHHPEIHPRVLEQIHRHVLELQARLREIVEKSKAREGK